ncbi:sensor domain-containing protein [Evansella halocellulosilytica]|uniref:sensor domain-containing protein n=1 Tax=Evansella halocellulosilytica TaxID=2011013 RepID=UPI000BB77C93|nr:EAL domain-containing protein [Evansella halocellulosilytica]
MKNKDESIKVQLNRDDMDSHFPDWFSKVWFQVNKDDDNKNRGYQELIHKLKEALEKTSLLVITTGDGKIVYVSRSFTASLGYAEYELIGRDYDSSFNLKKNAQFDEGNQLVWEAIYEMKNGDVVTFQTVMTPLFPEDGEGEGYLLLHRDITELKEAKKTIEELVIADKLTGLPNREKFEQDILLQINKAKHTNRSFAVFYIDLDRFKFYNDTLGHFTGDQLIKKIAMRLKEIEQINVTVYRYGGDEFSILLNNPSHEQEVHVFAEEILDCFQKPFVINGYELFITASIGISDYPEHGKTYGSIVYQAELAMHHAKERGKDGYQWYTPSIKTKHVERLKIEKRLRIATEKKAFYLCYQPQIDLKKKKVIGVEALIRWDDEELGIISPGSFIPLAEETGLIVPIGDWVLEQACKQAKKWFEQGISLRMGINISPIEFQRPDFVSKVKKVLSKTGLPPQLLDLEITENDLLYNREECFKTLEQLKEIGISISIDDFGTGYSSLGYLRRFPIDTLKIDQSFIREVLDNTNDQAIVTSIIQLAHNMNLRVIAEGVETSDMVEFLNKQQCDEMQGFLYSRPLPSDEVTSFIKKTTPMMVL